MIAAFRAEWRGLRHLNHQGYVYIWANLAWIALTVLIVTAPAAWAGMIRMSYYAQRSPSAQLEQFWIGFRENFKRGVVLALINVVVVVVNVGNLVAYRSAVGLQVDAARIVWVLALLVWFTLQLYAFPLFYSMEQPSLLGAFRNAAVMILLNPLFTLGLLIGIAPIVVISTVLPAAWLLLTGGALASIATHAVRDRLQAAGVEAPPKTAAVPSDEAFYDLFE